MNAESPNPRPRRQRRTRDNSSATDPQEQAPNAVPPNQPPPDGVPAAQVPPQATAPPQAPTPPQAQVDPSAALQQMFQFVLHTQRQQQEQMATMFQQQVLFQQQWIQTPATAQRAHKKKGNPPTFNGQSNEDLELWIFSTEQYYSDCRQEMASASSDFVDMIFANLGAPAQTWYREFKLSLGDQPATWSVFKERIRERFRDCDFQFKVLSKLHSLHWTGSQQAYTTRFLQLLSQVDCELPDVVKRWFYQQNLRSDTSAFVSQNVPETLQQVIELAQRFEDARPPPVQKKEKPNENLRPRLQ